MGLREDHPTCSSLISSRENGCHPLVSFVAVAHLTDTRFPIHSYETRPGMVGFSPLRTAVHSSSRAATYPCAAVLLHSLSRSLHPYFLRPSRCMHIKSSVIGRRKSRDRSCANCQAVFCRSGRKRQSMPEETYIRGTTWSARSTCCSITRMPPCTLPPYGSLCQHTTTARDHRCMGHRIYS